MLTHKFSIYVPSTMGVNNAVNNSEYVAGCLAFLSGLFGGATSQDCRGAWVSSSAGLVVENVTICFAFCGFWDMLKYRRLVRRYAAGLRDDMKQEAISVEIDGRLYFV